MIYQGIKKVVVRSEDLKGRDFFRIANEQSRVNTWTADNVQFRFAWFAGEKFNMLFLSNREICSDKNIYGIIGYCEANL